MEAFLWEFLSLFCHFRVSIFCIPNKFALITSIPLACAMSTLYNINEKKAIFSLQINPVIALTYFLFLLEI